MKMMMLSAIYYSFLLAGAVLSFVRAGDLAGAPSTSFCPPATVQTTGTRYSCNQNISGCHVLFNINPRFMNIIRPYRDHIFVSNNQGCWNADIWPNDPLNRSIVIKDKSFNCTYVQRSSTQLCTGECYQSATQVGLTRRFLQTTDEQYRNYVTACGDVDYEVSLFVDSHMYGLAFPKSKEAIDAGCPHLMTHARYNTSDPTASFQKELEVLNNKPSFHHKNAISIGTFAYSELIDAYEGIDPDSITRGKPYNIITNNCADYLLSLASALGVSIDSQVKTYVARRLLESSGKKLVNEIRNGVNFFSMFSGRNLRGILFGASDEHVVELLVEHKASEF